MTVIACSDDSLNLALEMKRRQLGAAAWSECVAEAKERERIVLGLGRLVEGGASFGEALKRVDAKAAESTVRRWIQRHEEHGLAGLVPLRGQLPHGHPDPVIKARRRRSSKPRSFIKWAGSKASVLPHVLSCFPKEFRTYYEPMVGSGVVFFALGPPDAVLGDVNHEIIGAYEVLRDSVDELCEVLKKHENTSEHYFRVRAQDPAELSPVERAARFIYLNKTCFNGMYRVNRKGRFNVPYGRIGHANICDDFTLAWTSRMLAGVRLRAGDYRRTLAGAGPGDLVYLDPPYLVPKASGKRCHLYQPEAFDEEEHVALASFVKELTARGCHVIVSNADIPEVHELYAGLDLRVLDVRRPINRNAGARDGHREVLILGRPDESSEAKSQRAAVSSEPALVSSSASSPGASARQLSLPIRRR